MQKNATVCLHADGDEDGGGGDTAMSFRDASLDGTTTEKSKDAVTLKVGRVAGNEGMPLDEGGTAGSILGSCALARDLVSGSTEVHLFMPPLSFRALLSVSESLHTHTHSVERRLAVHFLVKSTVRQGPLDSVCSHLLFPHV